MIYPNIRTVNNFPYIMNKKTSPSIIVWIMLLIIFFLIFLIISFNYRYSIYETYLGYVKNDNLVLYVKNDKLDSLCSLNLLIGNEKFDFKIIDISDEYYLVNNDNYYQVIIEVKLKEEWLIENNILNIVFEKPKTTIYEQIKKGLNKWKN